MPEQTTTLHDLQAAVARFVSERDWDVYHTPKSLSMSVAIEAAEIMELFQWHGNEASRAVAANPAWQAELAGELADVLIYALALANVYGPRQDPHGEAGVVAIFAGKLLAGEPCTVFGDGAQTRDYVYVDDVVDAFVRAAHKGDGLIINIGTGVETSVTDLYATMARVAGVDRAAQLAEARPGELARSSLDAGRAEMQLGWKTWTDLATGSASVLEYFRTKAS